MYNAKLIDRMRLAACYVSYATRSAIAILLFVPTLAIGNEASETNPVSDFYITLTANGLYLCGEGFGGLYGCIDEAVSREAKSVVISASSQADAEAVQDVIAAVHAAGFDQVGFATIDEPGT